MATTHIPGSWGKVIVMARRADLGLPVFQPRDAATPAEGGPSRPPPGHPRGRDPALGAFYQKFLNAWDQDLNSDENCPT
jgi:hypothetical protein